MEHKHTPRPWAHRNGRIFAADRENLTIANVARAADGDYSPANARLIAASPCLLAELQHAHQIILNAVAIMKPEQKSALAQANERDGCDGDGATRYHERADVIAKATGSQP